MFKQVTRYGKLGTVILDKHQFSGDDHNFTAEWLGIGITSTWHEYPDACFRIDSTLDTPLLSFIHSEEGSRSPGNTTTVEAS